MTLMIKQLHRRNLQRQRNTDNQPKSNFKQIFSNNLEHMRIAMFDTTIRYNSQFSSCQETNKHPRSRHRNVIDLLKVEQHTGIDKIYDSSMFDKICICLRFDDMLNTPTFLPKNKKEPSNNKN